MGYDEISARRSMRCNHLLHEMAKKYDQYDDYEQQDAHELLRHLLDSMEMEEKDVIKIVQPQPPPQPRKKRRSRQDGISPLPSPLPSRSTSPAPPPIAAPEPSPDHLAVPVSPASYPNHLEQPGMPAVPKEIPEDQKLIPFVDVLFGGSLASVIVCEYCKAVSLPPSFT